MERERRLSLVFLALALLAEPASPQTAAGPYMLEGERRSNAYTTSSQRAPAAAAAPDGSFVVAWQSADQFSASRDVVGRWFSPGTAFPEFRVNTYTTSHQELPAVAADGVGTFIVVWVSTGQDGNGTGVFGRRFQVPFTPVGGEFQVNVFTTGDQWRPAVAARPDGGFIIAWDGSGPGDGQGIFARRYGPSGSPDGSEFRVNAWTTGTQVSPSVAVAADGEFVIAYSSYGQPPDGSEGGVFARSFSAAGVPHGSEFLVNQTTTSTQGAPAVSRDAVGNFVIAWQDHSGVSGGTTGVDVLARAYDRDKLPRGPELRVNTYTTLHQAKPAVALGATGDFVVTWSSSSHFLDPSSSGVFGRYFEDFGATAGFETRINSYATSEQDEPALALEPGGKFLAVWRSLGQDGDQSGVVQSRWFTDLVFQDGFEWYSWADCPWSARAVDYGDLDVSWLARLNGTNYGLQAVVDDTAGLWVQDDSPQDEDDYGARFYFDTNGFDPGEAQLHRRTRIFVAFEEDPLKRVIAIVLRRLGGAYALRARVLLDDGSRADTPFSPISDGEHSVELSWDRGSYGASDGAFSLWIDGTLAGTLSGLDNHDHAIDLVRLGALSVKAGASGTLYLDEFESRRMQPIGP